MEQIFLAVHLLVALAISGLIMLQQGKGADMGASFGAGASQTLFGTDGSGNLQTRATSLMVALFFATSFGLALLANQKSAPVDDLGLELPVEVQQAAPAVETVADPLDGELPVLEDEIPAASSEAGEDDVPEL